MLAACTESARLHAGQVEEQRKALHKKHEKLFDIEVGKLVEAYNINCTAIMCDARERKKMPKALKLPERYQHLLQYKRAVKVQAPSAFQQLSAHFCLVDSLKHDKGRVPVKVCYLALV